MYWIDMCVKIGPSDTLINFRVPYNAGNFVAS